MPLQNQAAAYFNTNFLMMDRQAVRDRVQQNQSLNENKGSQLVPSEPNYIYTTDKQTGETIKLFYEDWGQGRPVVLIHGWPLSHVMWEYQANFLADNGYRVISYDRRGFGKSSRPYGPYDYNTLTDDLKAVMEALDLNDAALVGFSMGGGEVARYFTNYGGEGVSQAVLISAVTPFMLKTPDNPKGTPKEDFEEMTKAMKDDRIGFLKDFGKDFFGVGMLSQPISDALMEYYLQVQAEASSRATLQCADAFATTDFRPDMSNINVQTLIIHGDEDKTVPIDAAGKAANKMIPNNQLKVYEGEPHGLFYTAKEQLNKDLLNFLNSK